ncbi:RING/U-box superfamily protein [Perilla frutescens var. hirtella]|uniref:RING/U-box superfamily protein n=1 Tax=Perilla frutescens var. hirtella TaxID=608512 RepID=A0AAD4IP65_PERFH|nr:RING/U-box superfamily protein [Perilla frutescens var. hirtella]
MSTPPPPPPLAAVSKTITSISLGYAISIALGFLVFFSTVLLASYLCFRSAARRRRRSNNNPQRGNPNPDNSTENSIYLPRIIFVSEDDENESENVVVGLEQAVINSYPKVVFTKRNGNWGNDAVCSICLCEYREAEMLRMLPDCKHCFHVMCVDAWLKLNASCPVCRNSPLPTPLSTPLQEVVPLSQYADGRRR